MLTEELRRFWQAVYEHLLQLLELAERCRKLASALLERYPSTQNRQLIAGHTV